MDTVLPRAFVDPAEALSLEELLAGLLGPAGRARRASAFAPASADFPRGLLVAEELPRLARMSPRELQRELAAGLQAVPDGGERAALRLFCAFELARRAARVDPPPGPIVRGAADLEPHLRGLLDGKLKEIFLVVLLDAKNRPLRTERVSEGCLTWSVVHPREVFAPAVRESAGAIIVAHNHPSGDPTPSAQDVEVTARLARVGETLGIPLLDHIVVGRKRCVSMRAQGLLGTAS
jgi:DNA repair protein RadC